MPPGMPAMSVPCGLDSAGLPMRAHFVGDLGTEVVLLSLATQLEKAQPWPLVAPRLRPLTAYSTQGPGVLDPAVAGCVPVQLQPLRTTVDRYGVTEQGARGRDRHRPGGTVEGEVGCEVVVLPGVRPARRERLP